MIVKETSTSKGDEFVSKRRKISIYILLAYCIPYVFVAMYGDFTFSFSLLYVVAIVVMVGLGRYCKKTNRILIAIAGNILSFLSSYLFTLWFATEDWGYYFMAFPATNSAIYYSLFMLLIQITVLAATKEVKEKVG